MCLRVKMNVTFKRCVFMSRSGIIRIDVVFGVLCPLLKNIMSYLKSSIEILSRLRPRLPQRLKGGRIERIVDYYQMVMSDYRTVLRETRKDMKQHKLKSSLYLSLLGSTIFLSKTRPTKEDFHNTLIEKSTDIGVVPEAIRNPHSKEYVLSLMELERQRLLHFLNLGVFTIVYKKDKINGLDLYSNICVQHNVHWTELYKHVVDIGICGGWVFLDEAMGEYDVNPEEWTKDGHLAKKNNLIHVQ